jgi:hypothetical protein
MTELTRPVFQKIYIQDKDITESLLVSFIVKDGGDSTFYVEITFSLN